MGESRAADGSGTTVGGGLLVAWAATLLLSERTGGCAVTALELPPCAAGEQCGRKRPTPSWSLVHAHGSRPPLSCARRCAHDRDGSYVGALDSPAAIGGTDTPSDQTTRVPPRPFSPAGGARTGSAPLARPRLEAGAWTESTIRVCAQGTPPPPPPRYSPPGPSWRREPPGTPLQTHRSGPLVELGHGRGQTRARRGRGGGGGGQPHPHVRVSVIRRCGQWTAGDGVAPPLACGGPALDTPPPRGGDRATYRQSGFTAGAPLLRGAASRHRPLRRAPALIDGGRDALIGRWRKTRRRGVSGHFFLGVFVPVGGAAAGRVRHRDAAGFEFESLPPRRRRLAGQAQSLAAAPLAEAWLSVNR